MRIGFTAVAIGSSPRHFFRRIEKIIKGKSSFFPDPLKSTTTVATWVVFCSALASITVNEGWVVIYLLLAALTTPIWATPPLLLVLFAKDVFNAPQPMMGSTWKIYYMKLSNLEFRPKRSDKQFATLLSYRTYLALDYRLAIWAYVYLTIYFLFALSAFLILTAFILAVFVTGFMSGISIVIVIFVFSFIPALWLFLAKVEMLFLLSLTCR